MRQKVIESLASSWDFWSVKDVVDTLAQRHTECFFLTDEQFNDVENVKGFVLYSCDYENADLLYVYTPHRVRREGYASQLIEQSLQRLRYKQVTRVTLEVRKSNVAAQSFYKRHNFEEIDRRIQYYKDGEDAIVMTKEILTP